MCGTIPPLLQYAFMAWCLVKKKHRDNFTFNFTFYCEAKDNGSFYCETKDNGFSREELIQPIY
jgi:hypothetical protein